MTESGPGVGQLFDWGAIAEYVENVALMLIKKSIKRAANSVSLKASLCVALYWNDTGNTEEIQLFYDWLTISIISSSWLARIKSLLAIYGSCAIVCPLLLSRHHR